MAHTPAIPVRSGERHRLLFTVLGIADSEVDFERRGFTTHRPNARWHLERAGGAFVHGYNCALAESDLNALLGTLSEVDADLTGFAHEGAAMALALLDLLTFWRRPRWRRLVDAAPRHVYLAHVGAGWAMARLHLRRVPAFLRIDPLLWPLVADGCGFHHGFFDPHRTISRTAPARVSAGVRTNFDQGVGRSLWFVCAADPQAIAKAIERFAPERQGDLWSGVGLACGFAGGAEATTIAALRDLAGARLLHLAQGVVFAAAARRRAGNPTADTDAACRLICGITVDQAAAFAEETAHALDLRSEGAYEEWRLRIRQRWR
jgi:hypothetical protein